MEKGNGKYHPFPQPAFGIPSTSLARSGQSNNVVLIEQSGFGDQTCETSSSQQRPHLTCLGLRRGLWEIGGLHLARQEQETPGYIERKTRGGEVPSRHEHAPGPALAKPGISPVAFASGGVAKLPIVALTR